MANVLVIEDDVMLADDIKYFVEDAGHRCTACTSADEVMKSWGNLKQYDKIILDLMMRKGEILEVKKEEIHIDTGEIIFNKIRSEFPEIPILILTAKKGEEVNIDFSKYRNIQVIIKPLTDEKIKELLRFL